MYSGLASRPTSTYCGALGRVLKPKIKKIFEAMLWSDPRPIQGRQLSARGAGVEFGQDVTHEFLRTNHAALIIRSHECVREGFELLHSGRLITLFSARYSCCTSARSDPHFII